MTNDLFGSADAHDPGGKVRLRLASGVVGDAEFYGANQEYRLWLSRSWDFPFNRYGVSIGMNPSEARADVDDPTLQRDTHFMRRERLSGFYKLNVMDYRATHPKRLSEMDVVPCSDRNVETIVNMSRGAKLILVCWGAMPAKLQPYADRVLDALAVEGLSLHCLGRTQAGHPRHPLYLRKDTALEPYDAAAARETRRQHESVLKSFGRC